MPQAAVNFDYDERDQLHIMDRSNGVSSTYGYDDVGRVLSLTHAHGATVLNSQTYKHDEVGNRESYATNIAQPLITQPVANGQHDNDNKLLSNSDKMFMYDENGNLETETNSEGTTTYTWDARNRLASIATPDGQVISFLYDFAGNLIRKSVDGASPSSQEYVLDELTNIAYQKNSDSSQMSILTGQSIDTHLAVVGASGQVDFGLIDTINSTTATTDPNGLLDSQFFYEPFGQTTTNGDYPFQFTGRVPVTENLYHYRARFYAPDVGRFISEDPIGFSGGDLNLYRYVSNDPVGLLDPSGLFAPAIAIPCLCTANPVLCALILAVPTAMLFKTTLDLLDDYDLPCLPSICLSKGEEKSHRRSDRRRIDDPEDFEGVEEGIKRKFGDEVSLGKKRQELKNRLRDYLGK